MTTPADPLPDGPGEPAGSGRLSAAEGRLLRLVEQALDPETSEEPLGWLLSQLPREAHPRAARLLLAAQAPTEDGEQAVIKLIRNTLDQSLAHRGVTAQPELFGYRLRRFVQQRRDWVVSGVLAGTLLLAWFGIRVCL